MSGLRCGLVSLALLAGLGGVAFGEGPAKRPNILLLLADDLGWTDIHTGATNMGHGSTYVETPAIDRLATQGLSFTNMHVNPNCAPTRAALMTGEYAVHNGVYNVGALDRGKGELEPAVQHGEHIRNEAVALAETLRAAGYATCHVGKYHVSTHDDITKYDGFDVNYGGGKAGDAISHGYFAVEGGKAGWSFVSMGPEMDQFAGPYTKEYVEQNLKPYANGNDPSVLPGTKKHLTDAEADAAIDYMTKHLTEAPEKPFFMNVAFNAVHTVVRARPDLVTKYQGRPVPDGVARQNKPEFAALTEGEDQAVARILHFLDERGLAENTLVIFLSDNGGSGGGPRNVPLRAAKGTFYEGGLRVPMIARLPGVTKAGAVTAAMVNVVDVYPTFAEFAGAKLPEKSVHVLDGMSFAPVIRGEATESKREVTYYHFPGYLDTRAFPLSVIIKRVGGKDYKLIYSYEDKHFELYDLTGDFEERHDLLQGKVADENQKIAVDLRDDLHGWIETNHPLMATVKGTGEVVPLIKVEEALAAGNVIKRAAKAGGAEGG